MHTSANFVQRLISKHHALVICDKILREQLRREGLLIMRRLFGS